jgi:hypothetical protein
MKTRFVFWCLLGVCSTGCSKDEQKATTNAGAAPLVPAATPTPTTTADTKTGIAECDALLVKMQACIDSNHAPEALRASYRRAFAPARDSYRKAARGSAADQAHGAQACQTGLEAGKEFFDTCT